MHEFKERRFFMSESWNETVKCKGKGCFKCRK